MCQHLYNSDVYYYYTVHCRSVHMGTAAITSKQELSKAGADTDSKEVGALKRPVHWSGGGRSA